MKNFLVQKRLIAKFLEKKKKMEYGVVKHDITWVLQSTGWQVSPSVMSTAVR